MNELSGKITKYENSFDGKSEYHFGMKDGTYKLINLEIKEGIEALEKRMKELEDKLENQHSQWEKGICPKCGVSMFDKFSASIHNVDNCGEKKAINRSTEFG